MSRPIAFEWDGEAMKPLHAKLADREYVVGERYTLAPYEDRSELSHRHEFSWLREAFLNLPEQYAERFPTETHLRKRALIDAGYFDEMAVDAGSAAAAIRVCAAFKAVDDFSLVFVRGPIVIRRTAKSQSRRAMGAKVFQESKTAIMEVISNMIGVEPEQLTKARAA